MQWATELTRNLEIAAQGLQILRGLAQDVTDAADARLVDGLVRTQSITEDVRDAVPDSVVRAVDTGALRWDDDTSDDQHRDGVTDEPCTHGPEGGPLRFGRAPTAARS